MEERERGGDVLTLRSLTAKRRARGVRGSLAAVVTEARVPCEGTKAGAKET